MKTYAAIFAILTAFLAVAIVVLTGGCNSQRAKATSDKGDATADANLLKAQVDELNTQFRASIAASAKLNAEVASLNTRIASSQKSGDNGVSAANNNTGWLNLNYAPVTAAGSGVVILGLWLRHIFRMAKLDAENDKHTKETLAGIRKCNAPSREG